MGQAEYRALLDSIIDANAEALAKVLWTAAPAPEPPVEPEPQPEPPDPIPPQPAGKPGPSNTGPSDLSLLVPSDSITVSAEGAVIENVDVNGLIKVQADNVTLRNFRISGDRTYSVRTYDSTGLVMEDGEIRDSISSGILGGNFEARRLEIHETQSDAVKAQSNVLMEACWFHHLGKADGAHADCVQIRGGSNFVFRGNFFDIPVPPPDPYSSNACLMTDSGQSPLSDLVIEGNWLSGGNYTIYVTLGSGAYGVSGVTIKDNRFTRHFRYGPLRDKAAGTVISGNVWDDTGALMDINNA